MLSPGAWPCFPEVRGGLSESAYLCARSSTMSGHRRARCGGSGERMGLESRGAESWFRSNGEEDCLGEAARALGSI